MNASVGGVSILNIVLIFIAFYFLFLIFVVRYVLVVRQKNYLINLIEEKEGLTNGDEAQVLRDSKAPEDTKICKRSGNNGETYIVTMYIKFNMPLFTFNIPVKGQTRAIPVPLNRDIKSYNPSSCNR